MNRNNKVALVRGASSGTGEATALHLSKAGYKVYGTSRRGGQAGRRAFKMLPLDATQDASIDAAVQQLIQFEGRIDLRVNNAGFGVAPAGAEESSIAQALTIFDSNFFGMVRMIWSVLPHIRRQESGRIINIGSVVGFLPAPSMALYSATKHAVAGYSESLDHELRTQGIRVSVVEPLYIKTPFEANQMQPDQPLDMYRQIRARMEQRLKEGIAGADGPEIVADIVVKAASAARPKTHYAPGMASRLRLLRRFAPAIVLDTAVRKTFDWTHRRPTVSHATSYF